MRSIYIVILISLLGLNTLSAQWIEKDSLWIQDIISNGGEYRLNQETLEAIRNGTLLNSGIFVPGPVLAPSAELPVNKEFHNIDIRNNLFKDLQILQLPSSDILLYQFEPDSIFFIRSAFIEDEKSILVREYFRIPHTDIEITAPGADLFLPDIEFINGEWQGNLRARTFTTVDAEEGLEEIFDPTERNKARNRKDANAWKTYNMQEMDDSIR